MSQIFQLLRAATGVELIHYKPGTISRRTLRRMALRRLDSFGAYAAYLRDHSEELDALYHDLLIKVTGFFRDPDAFEALRRDVWPRLLQARPPDTPLRIWVPGCATGEEAYSLAISVLEWLGERAAPVPVRLFATDLDEGALAKARSGRYLENIELDVSRERLRHFFVKVGAHYRVNPAVRELCTFARHDLCQDPPFSHLDLVSCRNVLIYLDAVVQRRIIPRFHYALRPGGVLVLGPSETVGASTDLFSVVDPQRKLYAKVDRALRPPVELLLETRTGVDPDPSPRGTPRDAARGRDGDVFQEADRAILQAYGPTGVLITEQLDILQFRGDTSHFLRPAPGKASLNLRQMGREGLLGALRAAMADAKRTGGPARRDVVPMRYEGRTRTVTLRVLPVAHPPSSASHYVVLFDEATPAVPRRWLSRLRRWVRSWWGRGGRRGTWPAPGGGMAELGPLRDELEATQQSLQAVIDQREAANEELRAGSEELLSANEELQSTNEELETAKEELQSANEGLTTVNDELRGRNAELAQANDDLNNLFRSGHLPVVLLDRDLRIRRVTATAEQVLHIIPTDVGRPLAHLNLTIPLPKVEAWLGDVLDTGRPVEREVQDRDGHWYSLRLHPYRTTEHAVAGAVLVAIDIGSVKDVDRLTHLLIEAQAARRFAEAIVETVREPLVLLDDRSRVLTANAAFYRTFQVTKAATEGRVLDELGDGQWDIPALRTLLEALHARDTAFEDFAVAHDFPGIGLRHMRLNARRVRQAGAVTVLLAIEDVTEQTRADERLKASLAEKEVLLREIHHRVKNNLQIVASLLNLQFGNLEDPGIRTLLEDSRRRIDAMALVHEQLYRSADLARIDLGAYVRRVAEQLSQTAAGSGLVHVSLQADEIHLRPDAAIPCGLILTELLANALKHGFPAGQPGEVQVELRAPNGREVTLVVRDTGVGFPEDLDFRDTDSLGLQLVGMLTAQLRGTITLDRHRGTTFTLTFPLV
jgi:two-component system CheB/CheR fusion protein